MDKKQWQIEMVALSGMVTWSIRIALQSGLTREECHLAAQVALINSMRIEGIDEDTIIQEAKKASPHTVIQTEGKLKIH